MASPSFDLDEPQENQPSLIWSTDEYDVSLPNGDYFPSDWAICDSAFFNSSGYYQLLCMQENEPIFGSSWLDESSETEEACDAENWLRQCDSIFTYPKNEINDILERTECLNPSEEQCESRFDCEDYADENYHEACDYDPWSFCASWFGFGDRKISSYYGQEESDAAAYERGMREVAVYEGIFGYWPCLVQRNLRTHFTLQEW